MKRRSLRLLVIILTPLVLMAGSVRSQSALGTPPALSPAPLAAAEPPSAATDPFTMAQASTLVATASLQLVQQNYSEAKRLLDEVDALQPHQPDLARLHALLFRRCYEAAFATFVALHYAEALAQLDTADGLATNAHDQADASNLRGVVLLKQCNFAPAEKMFQRATQVDPGLWAAKFNYAVTPFYYRNFTAARARFEALLAQTDQAKQLAETELTHFEIFLTLLVEGKPEAARAFTQHFDFSETTPARYFCQAALSFYTGDADKAQSALEPARQRYPAQQNWPYLEAFRGLGWLPAATPALPTTAQETSAPTPRAE